MDGFELNKIAGAVLAAMLVMAGGNTLLQIATARHADKPGWDLPVTEPKQKSSEPEPPFDAGAVLALLPKADADAGAGVFKKCLSCHTPNKGGADLVGPNLYGIVGRKQGSSPSFAGRYSEAMKTHGGEWTFETLATYLHNPAKAIPGNKMLFAGIPDNADLADLLAYMRTLSDNPVALPK